MRNLRFYKNKVLHVTVPVFRVKYFKAKNYRSHLINQKSTKNYNVFKFIITNKYQYRTFARKGDASQ